MSPTDATNLPNEEMEVDYDKNVTRLYESISHAEWDVAIKAVGESPSEARTWVVRHDSTEGAEDRIMWRFLPIHSACARHPPESVIASLLRAYPEGAAAQDDQGMYPLHYACGNQASGDVIRLLLLSYPQAASVADPHGMLPIHYLAQWGPSGSGTVEMLLFSYPDVADAKDIDGNTPLDLAKEGDYPEREEVIKALSRMSKSSEAKRSKPSVPGLEPRKELSAVDESEPVEQAEEPPESEGEPPVEESEVEEKTEVVQATVVEEAAAAAVPPPAAPPTPAPTPAAPVREGTPVTSNARSMMPPPAAAPTPAAASAAAAPAPTPNPTTSSSPSMAKLSAASLSSMASEPASAMKTITKLKAEVTKLQAERAFAEAELEERMENEREANDQKLADLQSKLDRVAQENEELKKIKTKKEEWIVDLEGKLAGKEKELVLAKREFDVLESKHERVTKDYEEQKSRADSLAEHLNVLSESLASMLEKQEKIMSAAVSKDERMRNASVSRQKKLQELLEAEVELNIDTAEIEKSAGGGVVTGDGDEEGEKVQSALEAQKQQIESVAAIVAEANKVSGTSSP